MGLLLVGMCLFIFPKTTAQPNYPTAPQNAEVIFADLGNFVEAYRELDSNPDTLAVLQKMYFDRGSEGLKEFISRHQLTPQLLRDAITANPDRYALLPDFLSNISDLQTRYQELMTDFGAVLPNAMYPPTYLLVGANRGIGQASPLGQLITITRVSDKPEKLNKLIVHELSHFQQVMAMGVQKYTGLYSAPDNMLGICLREGGAEFVTSMVLGDITQAAALNYIEKDEAHLKEQFLEDLKTQNPDFWLWASLEQEVYPKLLGYAMGYKICESYYNIADDKNGALQEILRMDNDHAFLAASSYFKD
jgi:hypothetical protein